MENEDVKIPKGLLEKAQQNPNEILRVIIIFSKKPKDHKFIRFLNGKIIHDYDIIEGMAVSLPAKSMERLKRLENVISIQEDRIVHAFLSESVPLINADDVWNLSYTGSGKTVCIIDTGVDDSHSALNPLVAEYCYCQGRNGPRGCCPNDGEVENDATDDNGHGTHVAGIIASQNLTYRGVSPGADLMAVKVLDSTGSGYESDVIAGIDWCSAQNADVISLSLGGDVKYSNYCDGEADAQAINNAVDAGAVVSVASGNDGWTDGISSPACASKAISVGATTKSDQFASYTNRNEILDLLAPGGTLSGSGSCPTNNYICSVQLGGGFIGYSGTSMATPMVAGAVALLLEAKPSLTPFQVEFTLENTGVNIYDSGSGLTFPRIDVLAAITLPQLGHLEPYLIDPISDINVIQNEFFTFSSGVKCVGGECGNVSATLDPETEIYYDDGTPTTYYSDSNFIWAVRFTSPFYPLTITKAKVQFYDLNSVGNYTATVHVYDDNSGVPGNELITPFTTRIDTFYTSWEIIPLDVPIISGDFWIGITAPGDTGGPYALADAATTTSRSVGGDGSTWYSLDKDLMLRAFVKEGKGTIPMNNGIPFYTTSDNPKTCFNMKDQDTCEQTWQVNATGEINTTWEFFTIYDSITYDPIEPNKTDKVNITIVETMPGEFISITLIEYDTGINFGNLNPNTQDSAASGNYIIRIENETTVNVDLYQKGNDFNYNGEILGINNMSWYNLNDSINSYQMLNGYQNNIGNISPDTNISSYYWLDIPLGQYAGEYNTTIYIKAVETKTLKVHYIDVGQGDAEFIISPDGYTLLIDSGRYDGDGDDVVAYIQSLGYNKIDYIMASHLHADHLGGLDIVVNALNPDICYDHGGTYSSIQYTQYDTACSGKRQTLSQGNYINLGASVTAEILQAGYSSDENAKSVVMELSYSNLDLIFGGDCTGSCEATLSPGDLEVYKVHHHGSKTSSTQSFLDIILPEVSIIEVGTNTYGHPTPEALGRLTAIGSDIFRTDQDGTVILTSSDGTNYNVAGNNYVAS